MRNTRYEIRDTSGEEQGEREKGSGEGEEFVSLGAACLFFVGLGAAAGAVVMAGLFFWAVAGQAAVEGARWVGWVLRAHPGIVMLALMVVAVVALRLSRWMDEGGHGRG